MQHLRKIQQLVDNIDQKSKELGQADVQYPNAASDTLRQHHPSSLVSESQSKLKLHRIERNQERRLEAQRLEAQRISTKMQETPREGTPDNTQDSP